jgi:hypothetical protein
MIATEFVRIPPGWRPEIREPDLRLAAMIDRWLDHPEDTLADVCLQVLLYGLRDCVFVHRGYLVRLQKVSDTEDQVWCIRAASDLPSARPEVNQP